MITNKLGIVFATLFLALFVIGCSTMLKPKIVASAPEPAIASPDPIPESVVAAPKPAPVSESTPIPVAIPAMGVIENSKSIWLLQEHLPALAYSSASFVDKKFSYRMPKPIQPEPVRVAPKSATEARKPIAQLQEGRVAWNTPPTMTMGQSADVELRVTLDPERFEGLAKRVQSAGVMTTEKADLSKDLIATLVSTKFDVAPGGPQPQQVLEGRDAIWKWVISPKEPGNQMLLLSIESKLEGGLTNEPFTRAIFVNALPPPLPPTLLQEMVNFVVTNWDKLLTIVLIPIGGWFLRVYLKRRKIMRKRS